MQTCVEASQERRLLRSLLIDFLLVVVLLIPLVVCEFIIEPFRRGFFCDDETIRYPFRPNTVTPVALGLISGLLPTLVIVLVEFTRFYRRVDRGGGREMLALLGGCSAPAWLLESGRQLAYFGVGLLLTVDATEVGKYTMGRLRPHFIAVCEPRLLDGSVCGDPANRGRYIEDYECATAEGFGVLDVRQARLSFPSGHSSIAVYAMLYLALYLQRQLTWRGSRLLRHFLQFALLMLAWFTVLTRVMDNWHHWSDVLLGSLLGVAGALLTALYIAKLFTARAHARARSRSGSSHPLAAKSSTSLSTLGRGLRLPLTPAEQREPHDAATLQDVISTPPPYSLNSLHTLESLRSFSNEQYCTKV